MPQKQRLRVVSWNIHGCVGVDGRFDPDRVARILADLSPDVALLQEVGDNVGAHPPVDQATVLANALEMTSVLGTTMMRSAYGYGIVTLSRLPVGGSEAYDLSVRGREPRVCLCVPVQHAGAVAVPLDVAAAGDALALRTVNLHLGLGRRERRTQIGILLDEAGPLLDDPATAIIVGGDLNDWPPGAATSAFESLFTDVARATSSRRPPPTFPSRRPMLRLDRLYVSAAVDVISCTVVDGPLARLASDHLPLVAEIAVAAHALR